MSGPSRTCGGNIDLASVCSRHALGALGRWYAAADADYNWCWWISEIHAHLHSVSRDRTPSTRRCMLRHSLHQAC